MGWSAADEICREIAKTLRALRRNPIASTWKAERAALVAAERLNRALRSPALEDSLLPGKEGFLVELDKLVPFLRASSRKKRKRATQGRQRAADRRNIEYVFLGVLEKHGVPHGGPRAARALALVLRVTLGIRISEDAAMRSLMRARVTRRHQIEETREMQQLLNQTVARRRPA